jgi:hypothetical protein
MTTTDFNPIRGRRRTIKNPTDERSKPDNQEEAKQG